MLRGDEMGAVMKSLLNRGDAAPCAWRAKRRPRVRWIGFARESNVRPMRAWLMAVLLAPVAASAFCGFYVSGAGGQLFNDASMVVLVRDGTRTVLSMQNNYRGPPENFALV